MALRLATLLLLMTTISVFAVDPEDEVSTPPVPTPTSTECPHGKAWDADSESCVDLKALIFSDEDRYAAARELAYFGRLDAASLALDTMSEQSNSRVLTYRGFIARKSDDWPRARVYYSMALSVDPDNFSARSYLGLGLVEIGDLDAARAQLAEIRARGGRETWPERALVMSIRSLGTTAY